MKILDAIDNFSKFVSEDGIYVLFILGGLYVGALCFRDATLLEKHSSSYTLEYKETIKDVNSDGLLDSVISKNSGLQITTYYGCLDGKYRTIDSILNMNNFLPKKELDSLRLRYTYRGVK